MSSLSPSLQAPGGDDKTNLMLTLSSKAGGASRNNYCLSWQKQIWIWMWKFGLSFYFNQYVVWMMVWLSKLNTKRILNSADCDCENDRYHSWGAGHPCTDNTLDIANMKTTLKTLINLPYNNNSHERRRNSNICSMVMYYVKSRNRAFSFVLSLLWGNQADNQYQLARHNYPTSYIVYPEHWTDCCCLLFSIPRAGDIKSSPETVNLSPCLSARSSAQ